MLGFGCQARRVEEPNFGSNAAQGEGGLKITGQLVVLGQPK